MQNDDGLGSGYSNCRYSFLLCSTEDSASYVQPKARYGLFTVGPCLRRYDSTQRFARDQAPEPATILTPKSVQSGRFERLFYWEVDGQIYTQPLYVSRIPYEGRLINMVLVAINNSLYAFEAPNAGSDVQPAKFPLWRVSNDVLGTPLPYNYFPMDWGVLGYNMKRLIPITATPVIDRNRGTIYLTAKSWSRPSHRVSYRLFALDLASGKLKNSVEIDPMFCGPDGSVSTFDPTCRTTQHAVCSKQMADSIWGSGRIRIQSRPTDGLLPMTPMTFIRWRRTARPVAARNVKTATPHPAWAESGRRAEADSRRMLRVTYMS